MERPPSDAGDTSTAGEQLTALRVEIDGPTATVWLHRPHRHNAWTGTMHTELKSVLAQIEVDPSIRAVVITGTGSTFCVGADSAALTKHVEHGGYDPGLGESTAEPGWYRDQGYDADLVWLLGYRLPVIAAVNGACAGIGLSLVACCDLRFGYADAKLTTAAPKLGLPAEYGLSWLLPRIVGVTRAADLLLSGRTVTVAETESWGLWNAVEHDPAATLTAAQDYASLIARTCGPDAVTITKQQLYRDLRSGDVAASVHDSIQRLDTAMGGDEYREGIAAFTERRQPRYRDPDLGPVSSR